MTAPLALRYVTGDATDPDLSDGRPAIIPHVCNDIGAWGAGFVVALSNRWREPEHAYKDWSETGSYPAGAVDIPFALGRVQLVPVTPQITVANMVGQRGIVGASDGPPIRYPALALCLRMVRVAATSGNAHVHMPRIGAGLAGGDWNRIEGMVITEMRANGVPVTVYDLPAR